MRSDERSSSSRDANQLQVKSSESQMLGGHRVGTPSTTHATSTIPPPLQGVAARAPPLQNNVDEPISFVKVASLK